MTPERWDQIERLASAVLELPADQRSAYLERETGDDTALRREVESLLDAGDLHPDFMVGSLVRRMPEYVGPYRVVRSLGAGGMGEVLLAIRDDGTFQQRVAIKLLRGDLVTEGFQRRFHAERRILARLNHPGIAPLFDGGETPDGRPYFVMEYVEGEPLTSYCDRNRLSIRDRLRLFEHLCETVHYAHQNLVIHRDLKPGNVLVRADGIIRLLDFGIAKLLDAEPEDDGAPTTRTGVQLMTPEYAAPEQIRGEPATTSTDVYALGVILYELVSGVRPFAREGRSRHEVERAICDEEPASPSRAVSPGLESEISLARSTRPERLRRILRGDLENVVLTAMRKEPERRYASAEQLAEDVRRYLEGRPVMARKDTWSYRTSRFVRRHRTGVFFSAVAVAALITMGITAVSQRNRAEVEARRSEEVADFLQGIFESATPNVSGGQDVTARELLERGAARIDHELDDRPEVQVRMLRTIARAFQSLGSYDRARPLAERAVALARELYGADHPETALALVELASVARFQGRHGEAERLLRAALAIQEHSPGDNRLDLARTRDRLGWLLREIGRYDEAEGLLRRAVDAFRSDPDAQPGDLAISLQNLGTTLFQRGDLDAAEPLQRQSLAMMQASFGVENTEVATALLNLGKTLHDRGELAEAEPLFRESLALWRRLVGEDHRSIAIVQTRLGWLLHDTGRLDEAKAVMDSVLALRRRLHDGPHIGIASALSGVAMIHLARNDPTAAEPYYRAALDTYLQLLGPDHPFTATSRYNLGRALRLEGELDEAEGLLRQALSTRSQTLDPNHPQLAQSHLELGRLLIDRGLPEQAEAQLGRALEINERVFGDSARQVQDVRTELERLHPDVSALSVVQ